MTPSTAVAHLARDVRALTTAELREHLRWVGEVALVVDEEEHRLHQRQAAQNARMAKRKAEVEQTYNALLAELERRNEQGERW